MRLVSARLPWPNVRVSSSVVLRLLPMFTLIACTASPLPAAKPELMLVPHPSPMGPAPEANDERETSPPALPPELRPCSDANPGGCRAPKPQRAKLDTNQRYAVAVRVDDPSLGPAEAPVTLVVFSDFQCPFCSQLEPVLTELRKRFPSQVKIVWKDLPLSIHAFATPAAMLSREAYIKHGNERFWHVHDELFAHQSVFDDQWFAAFAKAEQLTWPPSQIYLPRVEQSVQQADELSIGATPTVFVNGRPVVGAEHVSVYTDLINAELAK